jgi:hypothetical protein
MCTRARLGWGLAAILATFLVLAAHSLSRGEDKQSTSVIFVEEENDLPTTGYRFTVSADGTLRDRLAHPVDDDDLVAMSKDKDLLSDKQVFNIVLKLSSEIKGKTIREVCTRIHRVLPKEPTVRIILVFKSE